MWTAVGALRGTNDDEVLDDDPTTNNVSESGNKEFRSRVQKNGIEKIPRTQERNY